MIQLCCQTGKNPSETTPKRDISPLSPRIGNPDAPLAGDPCESSPLGANSRSLSLPLVVRPGRSRRRPRGGTVEFCGQTAI